MKYLFSLLIIFISFAATAQVQRAHDDLPENKVNPKGKQPAVFDRRMHEMTTNKHAIEKRKHRLKKRENKEIIEDIRKGN